MINPHRIRLLLAPSHSRGKYGRLLAYVVLQKSGESFNELLLEGGYAYADWRWDHPQKSQYKSIERQARKRSAGLWAEVKPEDMPEWRRRMEAELGYQPP